MTPVSSVWLVDLTACAPALTAVMSRHALMPAVPEPSHMAPSAEPAASATAIDAKLVSRMALRALLAAWVGPDRAREPFVLGPAGKPALQPAAGLPLVHFSLAHIDTLALVALSPGGPVGVDLEGPRPVRIHAERRIQLEGAATALCPLVPLPDGDADRRFLQAWVRLEALAKATGEGISSLLGRLGVRGRSLAEPAETTPSSPAFVVHDLTLGPSTPLPAAMAGTPTALPPGMAAPPVRPFPSAETALEELIRHRGLCHG